MLINLNYIVNMSFTSVYLITWTIYLRILCNVVMVGWLVHSSRQKWGLRWQKGELWPYAQNGALGLTFTSWIPQQTLVMSTSWYFWVAHDW